MMLLHLSFHGQSSCDDKRHTGVVALSVAGGTWDDRLDIWITGYLGHTPQIIFIASQRDQRPSSPHVAVHAVGMPETPLVILKPFLARMPVK